VLVLGILFTNYRNEKFDKQFLMSPNSCVDFINEGKNPGFSKVTPLISVQRFQHKFISTWAIKAASSGPQVENKEAKQEFTNNADGGVLLPQMIKIFKYISRHFAIIVATCENYRLYNK
jgi:hypothetical protein